MFLEWKSSNKPSRVSIFQWLRDPLSFKPLKFSNDKWKFKAIFEIEKSNELRKKQVSSDHQTTQVNHVPFKENSIEENIVNEVEYSEDFIDIVQLVL